MRLKPDTRKMMMRTEGGILLQFYWCCCHAGNVLSGTQLFWQFESGFRPEPCRNDNYVRAGRICSTGTMPGETDTEGCPAASLNLQGSAQLLNQAVHQDQSQTLGLLDNKTFR